jgi:hypothetical protein
MRLMVRLLLGMCSMAYAGGEELAQEARVVPVPVSRVDQSVCVANGPVVAVTESPPGSGLYTARCGDGVALLTGQR